MTQVKVVGLFFFLLFQSLTLFANNTNEVSDEWPQLPRSGKKVIQAEATQKETPVNDKPQPQTKESDSAEWTKIIGQKIVLRATPERLYISAGDTQIVLDQSGQLSIKAGQGIIIESAKDLVLKAGQDIQLKAGGRVVQQIVQP